MVPCLPRGALLEIVPFSYVADHALVKRKFILDSNDIEKELLNTINDKNIFQVVIYTDSSTPPVDNDGLMSIRIGSKKYSNCTCIKWKGEQSAFGFSGTLKSPLEVTRWTYRWSGYLYVR